MKNGICVFCSSSSSTPEIYHREAILLGELIARSGRPLIYGGASIGLMGMLAKTVTLNGGKVIGVIPESLQKRGIAYEEADKLILTGDLRERKAIMEDFSSAFIALPGGFGTLEEILEITTLKQLRMIKAPVVLINTEGFYDSLIELRNRMLEENFMIPENSKLIHTAENSSEAMNYIESYIHEEMPSKWL